MDGTECHEAHEVLEQLVIACCDAPEVFEFTEEAFDGVALFVERPVAVMRSAAIVSWRDNGRRTSLQDRVVEVLSVIGPVCDDGLAGDVPDEVSSVEHLTAMPGTGDQADGIAEAVGGGVELGAEPAF